MRILAVSLKHSHKSFEDEYMSLINTEVKAFNATAYQNGEFIELSEQNLKGRWSVVFFYPADFTFVCPTELGDLADHYAEFKKLISKSPLYICAGSYICDFLAFEALYKTHLQF